MSYVFHLGAQADAAELRTVSARLFIMYKIMQTLNEKREN